VKGFNYMLPLVVHHVLCNYVLIEQIIVECSEILSKFNSSLSYANKSRFIWFTGLHIFLQCTMMKHQI
jgi:hypothetical protein